MEKSINSQQGVLQFCDHFHEVFDLSPKQLSTYSPLTLAYLGDAVYELLIRTVIVERGNAPVHKLHKRSAALVKAQTQADLIKKLESGLSEAEEAVYKRGRNAKSYTVAKNATMTDYRMATGFEALIGYLYLKRDFERIFQLIRDGLSELL